MKPEELKLILKEGEGLTVEFKESYTPRIDRDIVAFANSKGGLLLLGVDDRGKADCLTELQSGILASPL